MSQKKSKQDRRTQTEMQKLYLEILKLTAENQNLKLKMEGGEKNETDKNGQDTVTTEDNSAGN